RPKTGPASTGAGRKAASHLRPQVAPRWENRRRELEAQLRQIAARQQQARESDEQAAEEAAVAYMIEQLSPEQLDRLVQQAIDLLPEPLVRRNPTLSNPFVRSKVRSEERRVGKECRSEWS